MTLTARDEGGNEGRSEPFTLHLPERAFTKPLAKALVEQRRNLALDARVRSQLITAVDALTLGPDKFRTEGGIYLGLRSIFWSLVRAKSDDDLREVAAGLWSMAVGLEDGDISEAQAALRAAQEALRNALDRGAGDQELKQLMEQLRAAMDRFMQVMQEQLKNNQQLSRPLDRNSRMLRQQDLKNMLDRLESMARSGAKDAVRELLQQLEQMMENLQMATPDMNIISVRVLSHWCAADQFDGAAAAPESSQAIAGRSRPNLCNGDWRRDLCTTASGCSQLAGEGAVRPRSVRQNSPAHSPSRHRDRAWTPAIAVRSRADRRPAV